MLQSKPLVFGLQLLPVAVGAAVVVGRLPIPGLAGLWPGPGAYAYGKEVARGGAPQIAGPLRVATVVICLSTLYVGVIADAAMDLDVDGSLELYALRRHPVAAATAEFVRAVGAGGWLTLPVVVAGGAAFAVGSGKWLVAVAAVVATFAALGATGGVLFLLTTGVRWALVVSERLYRFRRVLGAVNIGVFVLVGAEYRRTAGVLGDTPLGWFADVVLLAAGVEASVGRAVTALAAGVVLPVVAVSVTAAPRRRIRLADGVAVSEDNDMGPGTADRAADALARLVGRQTAGVAVTVWLRVRRRPKELLYVLSLSAIAAGVALDIAPRIGVPRAVALAVYLPAAAGVGPSVNVLGNDGVGLPYTLTTPRGHRHLVRGYGVAAWLPSVVLVDVAVVATGLHHGDGPAVLGVATAAATVATTAAVAVSLAVGSLFPGYDGTSITDNRELQTPVGQSAAIVLFAVVALSFPVLLGTHVMAAGESPFGISGVAAGVTGVGLSGVVTVAVGLSCLGVARRRLRQFELN
jgi:hypothetical protein